MSKAFHFTILFLAFSMLIQAQDTARKITFLPAEHYFDPLILDPVESQSFASVHAYWEDGIAQDKIYSPLSLGFQLPVVQWDKGDHGFELGLLTSVFFQFEFIEPLSIFQVNLINTDFKVGLPFTFRTGRFALRTTFYHVSSHFSEEYIFRNKLEGFGENRNTYEALDVHASWQYERMRYYGGVGMVVNSPWGRGRWKFQAGILYRFPVRHGSKFSYIAGGDFQLLEETYWSINSQLGAGIEMDFRPGRTFQIMLQYFNGFLPYSQYTRQKIQYLGATLIGHPF